MPYKEQRVLIQEALNKLDTELIARDLEVDAIGATGHDTRIAEEVLRLLQAASYLLRKTTKEGPRGD